MIGFIFLAVLFAAFMYFFGMRNIRIANERLRVLDLIENLSITALRNISVDQPEDVIKQQIAEIKKLEDRRIEYFRSITFDAMFEQWWKPVGSFYNDNLIRNIERYHIQEIKP